MWLHSKGVETISKKTQVGGSTIPGVFTRENVNSPTRVTVAPPPPHLPYLGNPGCLVNTKKKKRGNVLVLR